MKSCVTGPLPQIPDDKDMIVSYWDKMGGFLPRTKENLFPNSGEIQNWYIYARPGAPILRDIIEKVVKNIYNLYEYPYSKYKMITLKGLYESDAKTIVLCTTGPIALTLAINNSIYKDTVLISSTINNSLKYMCQKNSINNVHYSNQTEPLVFPKEGCIYIPNTVYFTYYDLNVIPEYVHKNINKYCEGFNIQIYDDKMCQDFIEKYFGHQALKIFNNFKKGAFKADFWRYCILYIHGGLYFDIKTNFQVPIKDIFDLTKPDTWYTVIGHDKKSIYNGIIVTPPGNPIIFESIKYIYKNPNPFSYSLYIKKLFNNITKMCNKPLSIGDNLQTNNWNCILQQEDCLNCDKTGIVGKCDKYSLQCKIRDKNNQVNFKTRYTDFPWKILI
jgi:mannosyltransferase OCH1-like enzyme